MDKWNFANTFEYKLIYVFRINDNDHIGYLKIGDATIHSNKNYVQLNPNSHDLNSAAKKRINSYTSTAGISYELLYTEIAVYKDNNPKSKKYGQILAFRDYDVHAVLKRSGIKNKQFDTEKKQNEWFKCDLEIAKKAIKAVKENKAALDNIDITKIKNPVIFRPEQREAIEKTLKQYKTGNRMLWNAKMRFGKTLTALEVAKRSKFRRTIIITHRPVVSDGWFEDFSKIFYDNPNYEFGSKTKGKTIEELEALVKNYVYFASMQDLRGSEKVGGNFDKNNIIFKINWDFVVVDEAHEGTQTKLGQAVLQAVIKADDKTHVTKTLELSGTPFNLLVDYEDQEIYTWDYIMEQEAKLDWSIYHYGDTNPYEELPKLNIFTYHLEKNFKNYLDIEEKAFKFSEFFRLWTGDIKKDCEHIPQGKHIGDFVHEDDIKIFLNLICKESKESNYPYSTDEYRSFFRHTLWVLPGVKEAKALSKLLKTHPVFSQFEVVNVAGDGDEEIDSKNALDAVRNAITKNPEDTYTITLTCGRLTTGVSVPEWTAVLMLAGSYSTQASQYLQTIFRVQTPANIAGKIKENCYVFDFAPDRTLKMVAESVQLSQRGFGTMAAEIRLEKFLNFCPVISIDDSGMKRFRVSYLLQELKKVYAEKVVRNGFDDTRLYNDKLLKLTDVELEEFEKLKAIIGSSKTQEKIDNIDVNNEGFTDEEYEEVKKIEKKPKKDLTPEEQLKLIELKKKKKDRFNAISILRCISIRIPLLVYGTDVPIDRSITLGSFPELVDDASWEEFMPKGVTKDLFKQFSKYYDKDIFVASTYRIRYITKKSDELEPTERVKKIAQVFSTFKNPDKETVLTPWRVVNIHMSNTIGGYDFWDENHSVELDNPRFVNQKNITEKIFRDSNSKILEINSKSGLYPLYVVYTFYRIKCERFADSELTLEKKLLLWDEVVRTNLYTICKTPMAKQITKRTLLGYRSGKVNAHAFDDLINQLKSKQQQFIDKILSCSFWNEEGNKMKFSAVVGNPPYQEVVQGRSEQPPVYNYFWDSAIKLSDLSTLITPARFLFNVGKTPKEWNEKMLNDVHFKVVKCFMKSNEVFSNVDIKGGVAICIHNSEENYGAIKKYFSNDKLHEIYERVVAQENSFLSEILYSNTSYKYSSLFFTQNPDFIKRVSGGSKRYLSSSCFTKFPEVFLDTDPNKGFAKIIGLINNKRIVKFFNDAYLNPPENFKKYKVFVPASNGSGALGETLSNPIIGTPMMGHTETFISLGNFDSVVEASNLLKYLHTKFARLMLGVNKVTQGNKTKETWAAVPMQDFNSNSDIDWSASVNEIDKILYKKYNLTKEEIEYIESNIKPM